MKVSKEVTVIVSCRFLAFFSPKAAFSQLPITAFLPRI